MKLRDPFYKPPVAEAVETASTHSRDGKESALGKHKTQNAKH